MQIGLQQELTMLREQNEAYISRIDKLTDDAIKSKGLLVTLGDKLHSMKSLFEINDEGDTMVESLADYVLKRWSEMNQDKFCYKKTYDRDFFNLEQDREKLRKEMTAMREDIQDLKAETVPR